MGSRPDLRLDQGLDEAAVKQDAATTPWDEAAECVSLATCLLHPSSSVVSMERPRPSSWQVSARRSPSSSELGSSSSVGTEYRGFAPQWDRVVFRGDPATREFIAFWLTGDRVVAGMNVNVWDVADPIRALVQSRVSVDDRRLADPDTPLSELIPGATENSD